MSGPYRNDPPPKADPKKAPRSPVHLGLWLLAFIATPFFILVWAALAPIAAVVAVLRGTWHKDGAVGAVEVIVGWMRVPIWPLLAVYLIEETGL